MDLGPEPEVAWVCGEKEHEVAWVCGEVQAGRAPAGVRQRGGPPGGKEAEECTRRRHEC